MRMHEENSGAILEFLKQEPLVSVIYHPSLPTHPGHEIAKKQQAGFGGMLSFELKGDESELKLSSPHLSCSLWPNHWAAWKA